MRRIDQIPAVGKRSHEVFRVFNPELSRHTRAILMKTIPLDDVLLISRGDTVLIRRSINGEIGRVYN
jgi:hypothetical protein